jgi:hypothetical protein
MTKYIIHSGSNEAPRPLNRSKLTLFFPRSFLDLIELFNS